MSREPLTRYPQPDARFHTAYGPWAVVTGASSGIGRELALQLAAKGMNLVLVARTRTILEQMAHDLSGQYGIDVRVVSTDLALELGVDMVETATRELDVGLLVAAAGFGTSGPFVDADRDRELNMLSVNCHALVRLTLHFAQRFAQRRRGGIVLMSSIVGFQGTPHAAHYAATKAYVQTLAEALHVELAPLGVDVLASAPGPTNSGFAARAHMQMGVMLNARDVATATLAALGRTATVMPGWLSKVLSTMLGPLPRWVRVRIMGNVMKGMTAPTPPVVQ